MKSTPGPDQYVPRHLPRVVGLVGVVLASVGWLPAGTVAADPVEIAVDQAEQLDPLVKVPAETAAFSPQVLPLWEQALDRPDVEPRRLAIDTLTLAAKRGMTGLDAMVPRLEKLLATDAEPQVRRAAAGALVALDAAPAAAALAAAADRDGLLVSLQVEPALARWDHAPQREVWLSRLDAETRQPGSDPARRGLTLLAIDGLGAVREPRAAGPLETLVADRDGGADIRLAAARALGAIRREGLVDIATVLAEGAEGKGPVSLGRLLAVELVGRDTGDSAQELLARLAVDPEPAVATAALARLDGVKAERALEIARRCLDVADAGQRQLAARLVARPGDADCITRLGPLLGDRNPTLRRFVTGTLGGLATEPSLRGPVIDQGLAALAGDQWRALEQGALLLGHLDHEPAADRLRTLLDHDRDEVAVSAAWALRKLQVDATLPPLLTYATALRGRLQERLTPEQGARYARQAQQLHQLFGIMRFKDAEPLLREYVPKAQTDSRARSAAFWALGLLHEDEPECDLGDLFAERLADVDSLPPESNVVRWMAAVGLGRFKAAGQLETLQRFALRDTMYLETGIASHWALSRITGEPMPPEPADVRTIGGWFLERP